MDDQSLQKLCQDIISKFAEAKSIEKIKAARTLFNNISKIKRRFLNSKLNQWNSKVKLISEKNMSKEFFLIF